MPDVESRIRAIHVQVERILNKRSTEVARHARILRAGCNVNRMPHRVVQIEGHSPFQLLAERKLRRVIVRSAERGKCRERPVLRLIKHRGGGGSPEIPYILNRRVIRGVVAANHRPRNAAVCRLGSRQVNALAQKSRAPSQLRQHIFKERNVADGGDRCHFIAQIDQLPNRCIPIGSGLRILDVIRSHHVTAKQQ